MRIIVASHNVGKVREIKRYFEQTIRGDRWSAFDILSLSDIGLDIDLDAVEDGSTFEENAVKKAQAVRGVIGGDCIVLSEDSGLVIDALGGLPGVDSANFMGRDTPYVTRHDWILGQIGEERAARYMCVIVLLGSTDMEIFHGVMEGEITLEPAGDGGFGYDPIFYLPEFGKTAAQISIEEKNKISHRANALQKVVEYLNESFSI